MKLPAAIFREYDIRGTVGDQLTPEVARAIGQAFVTLWGGKTWHERPRVAVDRYAQRQGVAGALLAAALRHAFEHRASAVEAYPHVSDPRDYMGSVGLYEDAGFERVRDANKRAIFRYRRR